LEEVKKKKGGYQPLKMTPDVVRRVKERTITFNGKMSVHKIAETINPEFPNLSKHSLIECVMTLRKVSDEVVNLYYDGKIPYIVLIEFGGCRFLNDNDSPDYIRSTIDFLAQEYIDNDLSYKQLKRIKKLLRGSDISVDEAIGRVMGRILTGERAKSIKKIRDSFDGLLDEAMKLLTTSRMKVSQIMDLLPVSTLDKGKVHADLFDKAYMLRHLVKEQYEFLDKKVKSYLDEMEKYVLQAHVSLTPKEANHGDPC